MGGDRKDWIYPVLSSGDEVAITNKEKADLMVKTFVAVHSSNNLTKEGRNGRKKNRDENREVLKRKESREKELDVPFTIREMKRAIENTRRSAPGKDGICYTMIKHLCEGGLTKILSLFNKVWKEGKVPRSWKEAIIVTIRKPGKDHSKTINYRPIALTSHIGKIMKRMINERLMYYIEKRGLVTRYQSGFRRGRSTMDPVVCLEDDIRKAQVNKETVAAVFFDVEKAYDMLWREGLLIKMHRMGIEGNMFNWTMDF